MLHNWSDYDERVVDWNNNIMNDMKDIDVSIGNPLEVNPNGYGNSTNKFLFTL